MTAVKTLEQHEILYPESGQQTKVFNSHVC